MMAWLQPTALDILDIFGPWAAFRSWPMPFKVSLPRGFEPRYLGGVGGCGALGLSITKAQRPKKHSFEPQDPEGQELVLKHRFCALQSALYFGARVWFSIENVMICHVFLAFTYQTGPISAPPSSHLPLAVFASHRKVLQALIHLSHRCVWAP